MSFDLRLDNGRILLDDSGDVELVTSTDKLIQDILCELTIGQGSDIFNPERGATLNSDIVGSPLDPSVLLPRMQASIIRSLEAFKDRQQIQASKQYFNDAELLLDIENVTTVQSPVDPRQIDITIDVTSRALTPITISFTWQAY